MACKRSGVRIPIAPHNSPRSGSCCVVDRTLVIDYLVTKLVTIRLEYAGVHVDDLLVDIDLLGGASASVAEDLGDLLVRDTHVGHVAASRVAHLVRVPLTRLGAVLGGLLGGYSGGLDQGPERAAQVRGVDRRPGLGGEHVAVLGPELADG